MMITTEADSSKVNSFYDFTMKDIDGQDVSLSRFKGSVLLVVNVASECGYTPQYEGLERIFEKYRGQGFAVLGFPANNFGSQEPGSNEQIKQFCISRYHVMFPMFSKISVLGEDMHPLYRMLTSGHGEFSPAGDVRWNFEKFLVSRDGMILKRYKHRLDPEDPELVADIERALAK